MSLSKTWNRLPHNSSALMWTTTLLLFTSLLFAMGCATGETGATGGGQSPGTGGAAGAGGQGGAAGAGGDQGGAGGTGGQGGAGGAGGAGDAGAGQGGTGGTAGQGGAGGQGGGGFMPPLGTADYPSETEQNNLFVSADAFDPLTKGFTGSIHPLGDVDIYTINVTTPGSSLSAHISDGMGGCPPNTNAFLRIFDQNKALMASAKNGCPTLNAGIEPSLASLAAGTYYIQVESATIATIPFYILEINLAGPGCGDGLIQPISGEQCDDGNTVSGDGCSDTCQIEVVCGDFVLHVVAGEQCDDGNTTSGDGCSDTCQIEGANYLNEIEPNSDALSANSTDGFDGVVASIVPAGDQDFYSFTVTVPNSSVYIEVSDGKGGCPLGFDSKIYLYPPMSNIPVASDDDQGQGACSLISPALYPGAANLAVGVYTIKVEEYLNDEAQPFYILLVQVNPPGCGDFIVSAGEQCDDGNTLSGDGCSDTCQVEAICGDGTIQAAGGEQCDDGNTASGDGCSDFCQIEGKNYFSEIESNNANPNDINGYDGVVGSIGVVGDIDRFSFDVTVPGSTVTLRIGDGLGGCPAGFDSKMTLFDGNGVLLSMDDDDGEAACSLISPLLDIGAQNLPAGTYSVLVEEYGGNATAPFYILDVLISPPGCGDSLLQMGEQCDDGNTASGDGCSDTCFFEANYTTETEPNNMVPNAIDGFDGVIASISPIGDADLFSFNVTVPGSSVSLRVANGIGKCPAGFDSEMTLYDAQFAQLAYNDNGIGLASCSAITPASHPIAASLPAGNYIVKVNEFANNETEPVYVLEVDIKPPGCGDGVRAALEECDDGNQVPGDGCDAQCLSEPPWEIESNNTMAEPTVPWAGFGHWRGAIKPIGDVDWYVFNYALAGTALTIKTSNIGDLNTCGFDTVIHLVNSAGQELVSDDDDGPGSCSLLSPATDPILNNLPLDTYYIWVQRFANTAEIPGYQLNLSIQ